VSIPLSLLPFGYRLVPNHFLPTFIYTLNLLPSLLRQGSVPNLFLTPFRCFYRQNINLPPSLSIHHHRTVGPESGVFIAVICLSSSQDQIAVCLCIHQSLHLPHPPRLWLFLSLPVFHLWEIPCFSELPLPTRP
jgi:hypothetical protein